MLYLIRHAQSEMNLAAAEWTREHPGDLSVHWNLRYLDADITALGESQIKRNRPQVQSLPLTKVYVSPLRRTLKTCEGLIAQHPDNPEMHVEPVMTEVITDCGDLSFGNNAWYRDFSHYDWSALDSLHPHYWMFDIIGSPNMSETQHLAHTQSQVHQTAADIMSRITPDVFEPEKWAYPRVEAFKDMLEIDLEAGEVVGVVGHSDFFRLLLGRIDQEQQVTMQNCQVLQVGMHLGQTPHL